MNSVSEVYDGGGVEAGEAPWNCLSSMAATRSPLWNRTVPWTEQGRRATHCVNKYSHISNDVKEHTF
jgi:hypothetical protein